MVYTNNYNNYTTVTNVTKVTKVTKQLHFFVTVIIDNLPP